MADEWMAAWEKAAEWATGWIAGTGQAQQATWTAATRYLELMGRSYARLWGGPAKEVLPADKRFEDAAWQENLGLDILKQSYLITAQWLLDMGNGLWEVSPDLYKRVRFWVQQSVDALSPTNFPFTNPAVVQEMARTGGMSLVRGMQNLLSDLRAGRIRMVPEGAFEVGKDLAITPGQVIYRNELMELIQYTPSTAEVHAVPILVIPPWINKYYIMDLRPENSMFKYLVDSGFTLFAISWKNPSASDAALEAEWGDLMQRGPLEALRVVQAVTGAPRVNMVGYCAGGILLETALATMAARGDERANTGTLFATHQDFSQAGDVEVFISEPEVQFLELLMRASGGYLDGRNLAATFSLLRANDLLWHFVVHNYLLGEEPPAFDLLYWNSDGTRVPARIHSFMLREFFLKNRLREPDAIQIQGVGIDTRRITVPTYAVAGSTDHIVPWQGAFEVRRMLGGPVRFVLAESGHIAGIINPPVPVKRAYWTNEDLTPDPAAWLAGSERHEGSWWLDWVPWLQARSGERVSPPPMGSAEYPPLVDAPGTYVLVR